MMGPQSWLGARRIKLDESTALKLCAYTKTKQGHGGELDACSEMFSIQRPMLVLGSLHTRAVNKLIDGKWIKRNPGQSDS